MASKGDALGADVVAKHMSTKIHTWRGKYARMWAMTATSVQNVDPSNFSITNTWPWSDVVEFAPAVSSPTDFTFTIRSGKKTEVMKYASDGRAFLLCDLQRYSAGETGARRFVAVKITRASARQECFLELGTWYVAACDGTGKKVSLYPFKEITGLKQIRDDPSAFLLYAGGRPRLFATPERSEFLRLCAGYLTKLGMTAVISDTPIPTAEYRAERVALGNDGAPRIAEFEVLKLTPKSTIPRTRRLVITETSVVERDTTTYTVVSARPLAAIFALIRQWDEPQKVVIMYRDGSLRTYLTSLRDAALGSLLDAARNVGNVNVCLHAEAMRPGDRLLPFTLDEENETTQMYLANIARNAKPSAGAGVGPYNAALLRACTEFNCNVSPLGVQYATKKSAIASILPDLLVQLAGVVSLEDFPTSIIVTLLQTITRVISCKEGYKMFCTLTESPAVIAAAISHDDECVVFWGFELLKRVMHNPRRPLDADEDAEAAAKKIFLTTDLRVAIIQALDVHAAGSGGSASGVAGNEGTITIMAITSLLDSVLVSHVDTTPQDAGDHLMQLVASRYAALLSLFRCQCSGVVESSALLMRAIVDQADVGVCRAMQAAAISSGVWLRHFYNAIFAHSVDQRFVSRYLLELWSTGNATAREVLRHILPAGILLYLDMPKLKASESAHLVAVEMGMDTGSGVAGVGPTTTPATKSGVAQRLRNRLEQAEKASHNRVKRRLTALDEHAAGAKRGKRRTDDKAAANMAAAAAAAVSAQAAMTKAKMEEGKEDNYPIFFFQLLQDHVLPDLIWNQQTRAELRAALDAELREIEREIELGGSTTPGPGATAGGPTIINKAAPAAAPTPPAGGAGAPAATAAGGAGVAVGAGAPAPAPTSPSAGSGAGATTAASSLTTAAAITGGVDVNLRVAWNFAEFEVEYPSLVQELKVGDYYLRLFLESGESSVSTLRDPIRFFDALYRRVLRESAPNLKCMCLRGMARVYEKHHRTIGPFEDTDYMVYLLSTTTHAEVRDRLLLLLLSLSVNVINCEKMINPDCLELLVDLLTTAHTTDVEQRAMPVLKGGASLLLLTNAAPGTMGDSAATGAGGGEGSEGAPMANANPKESLKVWHYRAAKADLAPGEKAEKGPYSLQDMARLGEMKKLGPSTLVWAQGMREWVRLDSLRALLWFACSDGLPALTPVARGEVCVELLKRLVLLRPSVDSEGAPVRPVPRAKRVLCGPRTLPHIAQALLAGSPKLVDLVAQLVQELVRHNPKAMVKLYMTGVFFFVLGYNGSNWKHLSELLAITHLQQSFHADAASLTSESTLSKRSVLGPLLPESMICVLENRGPAAFAETFLSNVDTPEVIWKYSMRAHLLDMVVQHLGDLPARLAANPCTLFDFCPIPPLRYEELDEELWCSNFYLANLCDEVRFPDWPILDPVGLLRAVLDGWRAELTKTEEKTASPDEAYATLGIPAGSDDKEIRKAYRKLAIKFHPDKNPAGREMFEKIQKAYDLLTDARGPTVAAAGPDQVAIMLMVRTQCILFARHAKVLRAYKYAGYPLVLEAMRSLPADERIAGDRGAFLEACTRLVYLTCLTTTKNAEELVRENGTEVLLFILARLIPLVTVHPPLGPDDIVMKVLENVLHTLSGLATMKEARDRMAPVAAFPSHLSTCLALIQSPKIMQHALDTVSRLAVSTPLQDGMVNAGVLFRLIPLLFRYDATLEGAGEGSAGVPTAVSAATPTALSVGGTLSSSTAIVVAGGGVAPGMARPTAAGPSSPDVVSNEQKSANAQAKQAVRALGRMGGYLDGDHATPANPRVRRTLAALLTPPLAKRLARVNPEPLLRTFNGHEESALVVWNASMRKELLAFVGAQLDTVMKTGKADLGPSSTFLFAATREELRIAGIYIRFYVADSSLTLDDPYALTQQLMAHVAHSRVGGGMPLPDAAPAPAPAPAPATAVENGEEGPPYPYATMAPDLARRHLRLALRALHLVIVNTPGTEAVVAKEANRYLPPLIRMLERDDVAEGGSADELALSSGHGPSSNKAAAGSGASGGAGGARSTPAPANATTREIILTAVAAFAPNEMCAGAMASSHLVPVLIRCLPKDPGAFGPILRTLFAHAVIVAEMGRTSQMVDLLTLFAGGPATGPAPGKAGGPKAGANTPITVAKGARTAAAGLLSAMTSDATNGPPLFMQLCQLVPDTLATAIKESVSGATSAGTGTTGAGLTGLGVGAAGAGGGTGSIGDVVTAFDSDHETPELLWNAVCRHELRVALGELTNGLGNLRKKAGAAGAAGGHDGLGWSMPATFRVRYSVHEGELRVGGVYIRVFLKEPTFPLRDPKGFLEALLRRFMQEAEHLCGMTSEDADKARMAAAAAAEAAKAEEAAGGVAVKTRAEATGDTALVLRGEDVLTQLTHAIVCLLRVRTALADHIAALGYVTRLVQALSASTGKAARYNLGVQCVRTLQVCASSRSCVAAAAKANLVPVIIRSMTPLHRDAAFTLEVLKMMLETDTMDAHAMVEQAVRLDAITFLVNVLEKEKLDHLVDPSAAKVHAVAILKVLENDAVHGPAAAAMLQQVHGASWDKYRHQKHDLFLSRNDTRDYFLTDIATSAPTFMLKNTAEWGTGAAPAPAPAIPTGGAGSLARAPSADRDAWVPPTLHSDSMTAPPPAPEYIAPTTLKFGAFQAPAPAGPTSPGPMATPAGGGADPFAAFVGAPAPAARPAQVDIFATMPSTGGGGAVPGTGSAPDPFADLLG